jgi:hypothetical protein
MPRRPDKVEVTPSPRRLVEALRDVGYDFVGAVADLIDNSIAANATTVDINVQWDGANSWLRIADDGTGMDAKTITEALRFGSERLYRPDDLGKFGLGLKTASLSQCRTIYVASRLSEQIARVEARRFDLDRIIEDDEWAVEILVDRDRPDELTAPLEAHPGTVVVWRNLDRLFGSRIPTGDRAQAALWASVERLEQHLGMVFHRFIEGDLSGTRRRPLRITLNGNRVHPWNPFAPTEEQTQRLKQRDFDIAAHGVSGVVSFEPFVLPTQAMFSTDTAFKTLAGPNSWNQQQGFYIYRANRMIQSGGWSRMRAPDEHTKFARVALDFFPELDAAFGINIAKMRVNFPPQLRDRLKEPVEDLIRSAKRAYSARPAQPGRPAKDGQPIRPPVAPAAKPARRPAPEPGDGAQAGEATGAPAGPAGPISWPPPPLRRRTAREHLVSAAEATGDIEALSRIIDQLKQTKPEVADELGW